MLGSKIYPTYFTTGKTFSDEWNPSSNTSFNSSSSLKVANVVHSITAPFIRTDS